MTDSIVKYLTVPLDNDRAFKLFTEEMSTWWPLETHSLSAASGQPAQCVTVPCTVGEQVVETKPDGSQVAWGRVTEYTPGLVYGMSWHVGRSEDQASHLRVTFTAVPDGTQVRLVHSDWPTDAQKLRDQYTEGWDMVLHQRFSAACSRALATA